MADSYWRFEIHGLNQAQAQTGMEWIHGLDQTGIGIMGMEYTPNADNPEIDQNVLRGNVGGSDISGFQTRVRNKVLTALGRPLDLDESRTSTLIQLRDAYLAIGPALADRPELKTAIYAIWKDGARCMTGADSQQLWTWLNNHGFETKQEFKAWLNETP